MTESTSARTAPTPRARVLVAEDDATARDGLLQLIRGWGFDVVAAADGDEALVQIDAAPPDIVLADLVMPNHDGLALLRALRDRLHELTFVMITAQGTVDSAVAAMKEGAADFLTKPVRPPRLRAMLDTIVERQQHHVTSLKRQLQHEGRFGRTVGDSLQIREVYALIERTAPTDASVLICGESGTGKELAARTIHDLSRRASAPFIGVNCAAIPEGLLESEIFGHERGAFTGAHDRHQGCFELADHGTLFLDEIAEMAVTIQAKLLRVLQERTIRRLGGKAERPIDVRVLAATNLDPHQAIAEDRLREDLFYRLNVVTIQLPPLRSRNGDVPLLAQTFLSEFVDRDGKAIRGLTHDALKALERYPWPGNVRELRNVIERAVILAREDLITVADLPPDLVHGVPPPVRGNDLLWAGMRVEDAERRLITLTLAHTDQNKTRAAEMLGMSVRTLHNKIRKYELTETADPPVPPSRP